ncbi:MAG: hypothetical protein H3C58_06865, partial [Fimbriimonadaceae bacterium]|nr:hypothetical protein [Fimbriimonadaceae bacterium]
PVMVTGDAPEVAAAVAQAEGIHPDDERASQGADYEKPHPIAHAPIVASSTGADHRITA